MKLSEYPEYKAAIPAAMKGDFKEARTHLEALIAKLDRHTHPEQWAYALQCLADIEGQAGNEEKGLLLQDQAMMASNNSPLILLLCAKSLLHSFHRPELALMRMGELEKWVASPLWVPEDEDMSREWYEKEIVGVRELALSKIE